jgi:hypothetical protein
MANSAPLALIRCLARLMRWATVASGTRNARAISAVVSPPTARRVRATWEGGVSDGWQHSSSRVRVSSTAGASSGSGAAIAAAVSSRRRRAVSLRHSSVRRREATVISQPVGLAGTPSAGHCVAAPSSASCTASSQVSKPP